jgi:hypothetical protein
VGSGGIDVVVCGITVVCGVGDTCSVVLCALCGVVVWVGCVDVGVVYGAVVVVGMVWLRLVLWEVGLVIELVVV